MAARLIAILLLVFTLTPSPARAQQAVTSFDALRGLVKSGDTITVSDKAGIEATGRVEDLTSSVLVLRVGTESRRFTEPDVSRIRQRRADSLVNGTLIGAAVGAGLGVIGASSCGGDPYLCTEAAGASIALGAGLGAGIGVAVDAALRSTRVVYERPETRAVTLHVAPVLGRRRVGAALSLVY